MKAIPKLTLLIIHRTLKLKNASTFECEALHGYIVELQSTSLSDLGHQKYAKEKLRASYVIVKFTLT